MKRLGSLAMASLLLGTLPAGARQRMDVPSAAGDAHASRGAALLGAPGVRVAATDARRGTPTFVWTGHEAAPPVFAAMAPETRARWFVSRHASLWRLPDAAVHAARPHAVRALRGGATLVAFRQAVDGVPVLGEELKVLTDGAGRLVALSGSLHPAAGATGLSKLGAWTLGAEDAVAAALAAHAGVTVAARDLVLVSDAGAAWTRWDVATPLAGAHTLTRPATARRVLFVDGARLVPAWQVEVLTTAAGAAQARALVLAAADGRVLDARDLTFNEAFSYRVWADPTTKNPLDGPTADFSPHPTGLPDGSTPAFSAPSLVSMEGFNHNPAGAADPWLAAGATQTRGNNVDAYQDHDSPDGLSGSEFRASVTSPGAFDRVYDTALGPMASDDQVKAAITQIFYTTNWLHDWWYDSGFDEVAGNAQQDNYGRGGDAGDPLLAEAQDAASQGQRNNANMSAMSDGNSPVMQMYLWSGAETRSLTLQPGNLSYDSGSATFGPTIFDVTGAVVLVNDGGGASVTDACEAITNDVTGKIALLDRGNCTFVSKVQKAQAAGAIGVILVNNAAGSAPGMSGNGSVAIPSLSLSQADGAAVKTALMNGTITAQLKRETAVERDGTIDNQIVAHEWGHYIHLRLVDCGNSQCGAMSEGWGDFIALHMTVEQGDDYHGVYAMAGYSTASMGDSFYYGIRRTPYSVRLDRNALTFKHISDGEALPTTAPMADIGSPQNSEVHNAGEIWATMMFEAYVALLDETTKPSPRYDFAEARRRMGDYVVGGMQMAPASPTFTEQRDAILAAAAAADLQDFVILAKAFARRGAGTGAISPARDSDDLTGVVESYIVKGDLAVVGAAVVDGASSCDDDGLLDHGETGDVVIKVTNPGVETLTGTKVKVASTSPGVSFPSGDEVAIGDLAPFQVLEAKIPVALADDVTGGTIQLDLTATNPAAATATATGQLVLKVDYDNHLAASATDDVESDVSVWTEEAIDGAVDVWERATEPSGNHLLHGADAGEQADVALVSPALAVGSAPFKITLKHRFSFEQSSGGGGGLTNWDGGVIEISQDGGATWEDVSKYAAPGYGGTLTAQSGNPLANRMAFVGQNAAYPDMDTLVLDFGTAFSGQSVLVRFRVGSDQAQGDEGWFIDDVAIEGISNTPFATSSPDAGGCGHGPKADAGPDKSGAPGTRLRLDGRGSSDADMDPLTFAWTQLDGPPVTIEGADVDWAAVTVPDAPEGTQLTFQIAVSDGTTTSTDTMVITVSAPQTPGDDGDGGGCGCRAGGRTSRSLPAIMMLGVMILPLLRHRRRARR